MERTTRAPRTAPAAAAALAIAAAVPVPAPTHARFDRRGAEVLLAATSDPATTWQDVFQLADANFGDIADHFWTYFFPAVQQEIVNRVGLIVDFIEHPLQGPALLNEFIGLVEAGLNAHFTPFLAPNDYLYGSVDAGHDAYLQAFTDALGDSDPSTLHSLDFWASAFSAVLLGNISPFLSMDLQFFDDVSDIVGSIFSGHLDDAFQTLKETPINVVDALLNGYGPVDLPDIPVSDLVPGLDSDATVTSINLGGIFSPGGSLFESLGLSGDDAVGDIDGQPFGTLGSLVSMQEAIAYALGWSGEGNPIDALGDVFGAGM